MTIITGLNGFICHVVCKMYPDPDLTAPIDLSFDKYACYFSLRWVHYSEEIDKTILKNTQSNNVKKSIPGSAPESNFNGFCSPPRFVRYGSKLFRVILLKTKTTTNQPAKAHRQKHNLLGGGDKWASSSSSSIASACLFGGIG